MPLGWPLRASLVLPVRTLKVESVLNYLTVLQATIVIYDYLLTLSQEVKFIWFSRWSYTKVLFLVIRYMSFVCVLFLLWGMVNYSYINMHVARGCSVAIVMVCAESVLAIRTWAAWKMNKVIGVGLLVLMLGYTAIQGYLLYEYISTIFNPFTEINIVSTTGGLVVTMWREYTGLAIVELTVLTLMATSAFRSYTLGKASLLWHVIHRDGILFYVYLLCLSITNIVIPQFFPIGVFTLSSYLQTMYSVLTTRVILNIRDANTHLGIHTELHTTDHTSSDLQFQSSEHYALSHDSDWT